MMGNLLLIAHSPIRKQAGETDEGLKDCVQGDEHKEMAP